MGLSLRSVCVYCGSASGRLEAYSAAARELGALLAARRLRLVYGGARVGLMGQVADAALAGGGQVLGLIPEGLQRREVAHGGLTELRVVDSMHTRKQAMADAADAFVALPGGAGTLDELFEIWTWAMLGIHAKPIGLLNIEGYYDRLLAFLDHSVAEGFIRAEQRGWLIVDTDPARLLDRLTGMAPRAAGDAPPKP